jgi:gamma-glutamylcyclotransferase (GGCT)/AIG2-like uncharacterized protein YtfP
MHKVFVYGSLLSGMGNNALLRNCTCLGKAKTPPNFLMIDLGWFPGIVRSDSGMAIHGEVYEVDDVILQRLNNLEGYRPTDPGNGLYDRDIVSTEYGDAFVYIYNDHYGRSIKNPVPDGDWKTHYNNKNKIR